MTPLTLTKPCCAAVVVEPPEPPKTAGRYFPLLLIALYLVGVVLAVEAAAGAFDWQRAMRHFMAGFFLAFSFFKMLDVRKFADAFAGYDVIARHWRPYALAYPFIELGLGVAYLSHWQMVLTNAVTLVVMLIGLAGVVRSLLARQKIQCACLGAVFDLPMSSVTLAEDALMALMAAAMLAAG